MSSEPFLPPPPPPSDTEDSPQGRPRQLLAAALSVVLVGSFLPWATITAPFIGQVNKNGVEGDGVITAVVSGLALFQFLLSTKKTALVPSGTMWIGLVLSGICVYDLIDVYSRKDEFEIGIVQVGVGLWMSTAGALVVLFVGIRNRRARRFLTRRKRMNS